MPGVESTPASLNTMSSPSSFTPAQLYATLGYSPSVLIQALKAHECGHRLLAERTENIESADVLLHEYRARLSEYEALPASTANHRNALRYTKEALEGLNLDEIASAFATLKFVHGH